MNKNVRLAVVGALASAACALAIAGAAPTGAPTMEFHVIPSEHKLPSSHHTVMPYRMEDLIMVVVNDPVRCGQTPLSPEFELKAGVLSLHYALTPAASGAAPCILVSQFTIENAPHRDLRVAFSGGPEAATVAAMQDCPNYSPKDGDLWVCLTPAQKAATKSVQ